MQLFTSSEIICCPIDGELKKISYRVLVFQGLKHTICTGCDVDMNGSKECSRCADRITITPIESPLIQDKLYRPYEE